MLLLLALTAAHTAWARVSRRQLGRDVDRLRRAGEPILPEDFARPAVPDEDNAAIDLRIAGESILQNDKRFVALQDVREFPPTAQDLAAIKTALNAYSASLRLLEAATEKPGVDWKVQLQPPLVLYERHSGGLRATPEDVNGQRRAAELLAGDLLCAHAQGDDARALRRTMQIRFIGRAVDRMPLMISHMVSLGVNQIATDRLIQIAPSLKIGGEAGATNEQLQTLIAALLTRDAEDAGLLFSLRTERMMKLNAMMAVLDGRIGVDTTSIDDVEAIKIGLLRPLYVDDVRFALSYMTCVVDTAQHPVPGDWPTCRSRLPQWPSEIRSASFSHPLSRYSFYPYGLLAEHYCELTNSHLAAAALAIRWYCVEHDGRFPDNLNELVPRYLPAVPADPMAAGKPLVYVRGGPAGRSGQAGNPIIYGVGLNGIDDGGSEAPRNKDWVRALAPWDSLDVVVHLTPQPRRPDETQGADSQPTTAPAR